MNIIYIHLAMNIIYISKNKPFSTIIAVLSNFHAPLPQVIPHVIPHFVLWESGDIAIYIVYIANLLVLMRTYIIAACKSGQVTHLTVQHALQS